MSQIGYMFLALGVQAWMRFHLMTHAFFLKRCCSWHPVAVILACHHEQNILRWAVCVIYSAGLSTSWWAAQHCRHCHWSLRLLQ
ncbi:hypothetical protein ACNKHL_14125 [Shigella flexneri]